MTKDHSWMYASIESMEFIDGVLEYCSIAVDHQVRTGFLLPICLRCVININIKMF